MHILFREEVKLMSVLETNLKRTHLSDKIKKHPVVFLTAVFGIILGTAAGCSLCGTVYQHTVLTKAALMLEYGADYNVFSGILRAAAVYLLFYSLVSLVKIHRLLFPLPLLAFVLYGFISGFSAAAFFFEFEWWGIIYAVIVSAPDIMAATAMILCLQRSWETEKNTTEKIKNKGKLIDLNKKKSENTSFWREIMLLFLSIGIEGVVIPLTLRILLY